MFKSEVYKRVLIFDGAMGTQLIQNGLKEDECPDLWSVTKPEVIAKIHRDYFEAGSDCVETNTFGANREKLKKYELEHEADKINKAAVLLAKDVAKDFGGYVGLSVGPTGRLMSPSGDLDFDEAEEIFYEQILAGIEAGADFVSIETMSDIKEAKAAFFAYKRAKEKIQKDISCLVSLTFEENKRLLMGTPPEAAAYFFSFIGADLVGANCSGGAKQLLDVIKSMEKFSFVPLSTKPNAGLPKMVDGRIVYEDCIFDFEALAEDFIKSGVRLYGGCCGTNPKYIEAIAKAVKGKEVLFESKAEKKFITSIYSILDVSSKFSIYKFKLTNDFSQEDTFELVGVEEDAILVDIDENIEPEVLKSFLLESQDFSKKPYIFNIKTKDQADLIDRYYFGVYGTVSNLCGSNGIKVGI
ncbi:homocysteine S-methyltransferase family protein [Caldicellulosiruptor naganoensis]|uniref:homocysteine S-methyltransferase family protein n=1 Tax=Caldicellulosiruptor naganoensis TaxID=29324 RepID=UPI000A885F2A|nr:homocysteine S-methyltransferase family protein [Caldicellulosiruptor naganoensis]